MRHATFRLLVILTTVMITTTGSVLAADWPHFLGPTYNSVAPEGTTINTDWKTHQPRKLWNADVGMGFAGVVVKGDRAITSGYKDGRATVYCFDAVKGDVLWTHSYESEKGRFEGTRSAPTIDGEHVYVHGRLGQLFCLGLKDGKVIWRKDTMREFGVQKARFGIAAAPLIVGDKLILQVRTKDGHVLALDKKSGRKLWAAGEGEGGYSTPLPYKHGDGHRLIAFTGNATLCLDAETGKEIWRYPWTMQYGNAVITPLKHGDHVFVGSSYANASIVLDTKDDKPRKHWSVENIDVHISQPILVDGYLYGFDNRADKARCALQCVDFKTGKLMWSEEIGHGTLLRVDKHILMLSDNGELSLVEPSPKGLKQIQKMKVIDRRCWPPMAIAHGRLYIRNHQGHVVCLDMRKPEQSASREKDQQDAEALSKADTYEPTKDN